MSVINSTVVFVYVVLYVFPNKSVVSESDVSSTSSST